MVRSIHIRTLLVVVAIASLGPLAGCGGGDGGDGSSASNPPSSSGSTEVASPQIPDKLNPVTRSDLVDRDFVSTVVSGHDLVPGSVISLNFGPGRANFSADCNGQQGAYTVKDGVLKVKRGASTLIGCPKELETQDNWLTGFLADGVEVSGRGPDLLLNAGGVSILLTERSATKGKAKVLAEQWQLNSYTDGSGNTVDVIAGIRLPYLLFQPDNLAAVFDGCNSGNGPAEVKDNGMIEFGPIGMTRKACPGLKSGVAEAVNRVVIGDAVYEFEGDELVLSRDGTSLTYTQVERN